MDIQELNKFAQEKVQLNTKESWADLEAVIEKYKLHFKIEPYDFKLIDFRDFSKGCKDLLVEIKAVNKAKYDFIARQKHNEVGALRSKERIFIEELITKIDYTFSGGSYFKLCNNGMVQHLFYFKFLSQPENKDVEVNRGWVGNVIGKNYCKQGVLTVGFLFDIDETILPVKLNENEKVLGVVLDDKFNICYDVKLNNEEKAFGYFTENDSKGNYTFQVIEGFSRQAFYPFEPTYKKGKKIGINQADIKTISV